MTEYAVYKGDQLIVIGTVSECAAEMGVTPKYIRWMTRPAYKRRLAKRKRPERATVAVKLEGEVNEL